MQQAGAPNSAGLSFPLLVGNPNMPIGMVQGAGALDPRASFQPHLWGNSFQNARDSNKFFSQLMMPNQVGNGMHAGQPVGMMPQFRLPMQPQGDVTQSPNLTGRPSIPLYLSCDDDSLSEYQCLVRKQIELFEARTEDVESNAQGRNRPIIMGQVGIRCRHCTMLPPKHRARGAIYYPAKLQGLYQAAQNMASGHLCEHCQHVPIPVRAELLKLRERKSSAGGGKKYWADGVRVIGVYEDDAGLRFERR